MWFSTALKTFNNYDIIMTNISNNLRMNKCGAVFPVTNFWVNSTVVFESVEDLRVLTIFKHFEREISCLLPRGFFLP